jgi:hypothetical protein
MVDRDSRRDLFRTLGALTPPAPATTRGAQDSGLFDLGAMSAQLQQAIQKARGPRTAPPPLRIEDLLGPLGRPSAQSIDLEDADVEVVHEAPARPLGRAARWFVAVTWLATAALSMLVATSIPAHIRPAAAAPIVAAAAAPAPVVLPSVAAATPAAVPSAAPLQNAGPKALSPEDLPVAGATSATPARATGNRRVATPPAVRSRAKSAEAPAPVKAAPAPVAKAPAEPLSLDQMIQKAVDSEKRKQH